MSAEIKLTLYSKEIIKNLEQEGVKRMLEAVNVVRNQTLEVLSGTRTGRTYKIPGTDRYYTASSPGEPPATATAELRQHINTAVEGEGKTVVGMVGTDVKHGKMLEFGTKHILPRPWLRVSFEKATDAVKSVLSRKYLEGMK